MYRLLQINVSANWGSHGKIAEAIGKLAINNNWESLIAYGRQSSDSLSKLLRIGNDWDVIMHGFATRVFDVNGLMSKHATLKFLKQVSEFKPDVIHLHNIHGYYLNYPILFDWLKTINVPVIWTLHDCWPWTGHCAYYTYSGCSKWQKRCYGCNNLECYPKSYWDGSKRNYELKKKSFLGLRSLTLIPVSYWLESNIKKSFLRNYPIEVIHNGIDVDIFKPMEDCGKVKDKYKIGNKKLLVGVANIWEKRKGLDEFIRLRRLLPEYYHIFLVGLTSSQINKLPSGITGILRTNDAKELAEIYSAADLYLNLTLEDNFPTTNLEALACGTPIVTYNTGGSPEAVDEKTGMIIDYRDIYGFAKGVIYSIENNMFKSNECRERAVRLFDKDKTFLSYFNLYNKVLS